MREFFTGFWEGISEPFLWLFNLIVTAPFRALYRRFPNFFNRLWVVRFYKFLNTEPEESNLIDAVAGVIESEKVREQLWQHIESMRMHIIRAVLAFVLTVFGSFFFTQPFMEYLAQPIGGLDKLTSIDMTESISVFMTVALFAGIALAVPYIAFELWLFAAPGLHAYEKKMGLAGIPLALVFFIGGAAFTYYFMLPAAIPFLVNFLGMRTDPRPQSYFSLITGLMFWIGLFFEFPLVIYILTSIGFVKPQALAQQWRLAIVIITIVAAVITPTVDPINQGLVMAPMIVLYFISIGLSYVAYAGRKRKQKQEQPA